MRHRATSHNHCHASDNENTSDNDDAEYVPGNGSGGDSESEPASLVSVEQHWDNDASQSGNENDDGGVISHSGSEEECSKQEKEGEENEEDDELEACDHHVSHGLWLGDSFGMSNMATAWEMLKSNPPQSVVPSITHASQRSLLLSNFGKSHLPEKSHTTSASVSGFVSGPDVNSSSVSGGQLNCPGDHVVDGVSCTSDSGVGSADGGIVSWVGVSNDL